MGGIKDERRVARALEGREERASWLEENTRRKRFNLRDSVSVDRISKSKWPGVSEDGVVGVSSGGTCWLRFLGESRGIGIVGGYFLEVDGGEGEEGEERWELEEQLRVYMQWEEAEERQETKGSGKFSVRVLLILR